MNIILKLVAWSLAAAIAFATLGPPGYRPHASSLGQDGEHALAFVLLGLVFGMAYTRTRLVTAGIAVALSGLIEILQLWAPGTARTAGRFPGRRARRLRWPCGRRRIRLDHQAIAAGGRQRFLRTKILAGATPPQGYLLLP
jgi:hypothetical protein